MNQLAFSNKLQLQERNPIRISNDSSSNSNRRRSSPRASPTHRRSTNNGIDSGDKRTKKQSPQRKVHVQFAVQNVPPSPLLYQHQMDQQASPYERSEDVENDIRGWNINSHQNAREAMAKGSEREPMSVPISTASATNTIRKANATKGKEHTRLCDRKPANKRPSVPRKPAWDADVQHTSSFFDTSIKKSTLFQPKPGDRKRESAIETQQIQDRPSALQQQQLSKSRQIPSANSQRLSLNKKSSNSVRHVRSTISTTSTLRLPPQPQKDFHHSAPSSRLNVFDRLSKPQIVPKSLLRSVHFSDSSSSKPTNPYVASIAAEYSTKDVTLSPRKLQESESSPRFAIHVDSPAVNSSPNQEQSPRSSVYSMSPRTSQQQQQSSPPRSRSPKSSTRGPSSSRQHAHHQNYGASVFAVLDRQQHGRIGVNQILEGLRLLRLPATHNQISDYVYLIHEGDRNTINLEEWEILVGTLDAASQPSSASLLRSGHDPPASALSISSPRSRDRASIRFNLRESRAGDTPRSLLHSNRSSPPERSEHARQFADPPEPPFDHEHGAFPRPAIEEGDYLVEEIQRRVDEMFQRAEDTARLKYQHEPNSNQQEREHGDSDQVLRQAASVVYSLKASLFPLVDQAEALLRGIYKGREGGKLSLLLPQEGLNAIAKHSDDLASVILDDILLDTVYLLNDEEKRASQHQVEMHHADQLDAILDQIKQIEDHENRLIHQGLALGYSAPNQLSFARVGQVKQSDQAVGTEPEVEAASVRPAHNPGAPLVLPLGVVMNIDTPADAEPNHSDPSSSTEFEIGIVSVDTYDYAPASSSKRTGKNRKMSASILYGSRYLTIEKRRQQFQRHRRLVESSLAGTGMDQCAVIEM